MTIRDQNGRIVRQNVRQDADGTWSANVWWGGFNGFATNLRRYTGYATRKDARRADISDTHVGCTAYLWSDDQLGERYV